MTRKGIYLIFLAFLSFTILLTLSAAQDLGLPCKSGGRTEPSEATTTGTVLWSDDFNDGNDDGWQVIEGTWAVVDSAYRGEHPGDGRSIAGDSTWTNYTYEGKFKFDSLSPYEATVMFRVQDAASGPNNGHYYEFANYIGLDRIELWKISNGATSLASVSWSFDADIWYRFELEVWGPFVRYFINDSLALQYDALTDFDHGKIGVKAFISTSWFDDLVVSSIPEPTVDQAIARGLEYLRRNTLDWQNANGCNGCHVQSQVIRAMSWVVAREMPADTTGLGALVDGMVNLPQGQRPDGCFYYNLGSLVDDTVWGAVALADYDIFISQGYRSEFLDAAQCLVDQQEPSGRVPEDYNEPPLSQGDIMATALSIYIWKRAYAATDDATFLFSMSQAEAWLRSQVFSIFADPTSYTNQDKVMLIQGLMENGASASDADVADLKSLLIAEQDTSGGWKLENLAGGANGFATGQALIALCSAYEEQDSTARSSGISWLLSNQAPNGVWLPQHWTGSRPSSFASTTWAILGLLRCCCGNVSGIVDDPHTPSARLLHFDSRPNPFREETTISFELRADDHVAIHIYNVAGQHVRTLLSADTPAGPHSLVWDGGDAVGRKVSSGVYFCRLQTSRELQTRKMIVIR